MDKNAIKKYAVWARRELISRVSQRAALYEITDKGYGDASADSVLGRVMSAEEKRQRQALIAQIREKGYEQVMEEIAYTWFNRFIALRFMEVNGYLPSRVRVFTDDENNFKPQILTEAINIELDGLDMDKVYALKNANDDDALFKYMIIVQCNALSSILPGMFQHISDFTELLFPDNLLREGSVIEQMVAMIPEEDWTDQVQIIGWLYQYYNTEPKDKVFADMKKNIKISKENIPAATQLFTPDWIVRYMVENSLGRLWMYGHPEAEIKANWEYYLDDVEQCEETLRHLKNVQREYKNIRPEELLVIDPCQGSGHILAYLFDVLMQIYESYGYNVREAAASIVKNNIWGLDIDDRASQLAYFSVMMKGRQYDRRFFSRGIQPNVFAIIESNHIDRNLIDYFAGGNPELKKAMVTILDCMFDAKEYGSILELPKIDFDAVFARFDEISEEMEPSLYSLHLTKELLPLVRVCKALSQKYDVVVTNPPYMGSSGMSAKLSEYVKREYPKNKADLFACCIQRGLQMIKPCGFEAMITMESWMFLSSFEKMRVDIVQAKTILNMVHMPYLGKGGTSLGINFGTAAFVILGERIPNFKAQYDYVRYFETNSDGVPFDFPVKNERYRTASTDDYMKIPGNPIAYWVSPKLFDLFSKEKISDYGEPMEGIKTGDNDTYLRLWFEVPVEEVSLLTSYDSRKHKWIYTTKGGDFRRWYGNIDYVMDWSNDGARLKGFKKSTIYKERFFNMHAATWTYMTSGSLSFRFLGDGFFYNNKGPAVFCNSEEVALLITALMNTKVGAYIQNFLNPTLTILPGNIRNIPFYIPENLRDKVLSLASECVELSKDDWDSFEYSCAMKRHPLIRKVPRISEAFNEWEKEAELRFRKVQSNEEVLNNIFISLYGLEEELDASVPDEMVTVRRADRMREVKSLISYAVGCMFGRYSVDEPGIIYAGGTWQADRYKTIPVDKDNIIPICDDEYFSDDIVGRFVRFVSILYGSETLEENLRYIADSLGGKGTPREVIRNYFINDFFSDHCSAYSVTGSGRRPIYWLFDSGKKNGFKCLIYVHRYQPDTIARIRTDYVHEQQSRYRTAISDLESRIVNAGTDEKVKLSKQLAKLQDQSEELRVYEEKIHHFADQMIRIDLEAGIQRNYAIFQDVLAKIK